MKNIFLFIIFSTAGLLTIHAQIRPKFEQITKDVAMKYFREPFIRSDANTIRRLYGRSVGNFHERDPSTIVHSVCFLKSDIDSIHIQNFFRGKIKVFLATLPRINPALYDGYRIHTGINDKTNVKKAVYILTFAKKIDIPKSKRTKEHPDKYYLDDNLELGIYIMNGLPLNFEPIIKHDIKSIVTHLSCNPHCDGDKLKP